MKVSTPGSHPPSDIVPDDSGGSSPHPEIIPDSGSSPHPEIVPELPDSGYSPHPEIVPYSGSSPHPEIVPDSGSSPLPEIVPGSGSSPHPDIVPDSGSSPHPDIVTDSGGSSSHHETVTGSGAIPRTYMTQKRRREAKKKKLEDKKKLYMLACQKYKEGKFSNINEASKHFGLSYTSLYRYLVNGDTFNGKGRRSEVLTDEEEQKIVSLVIYRQKIGCGMTFLQLQMLIQEVLLGVTASNPERSSPYADNGHFPNRQFARKLAIRHNLTLRATMEISKGRQILSVNDLVAWQKDTQAGLIDNDVLCECFKDSNRVFNQDETSIQVGSGSQKVLAERGTEVLYNNGGSSREHVTASYTVAASGSCVPVRIIYKGVRNMAAQHLKHLPTNGKSGPWKFGVTQNGYVTREAFMDILGDLDEYMEEHNIPRPALLFLDGHKGHISLEAAAFCKLKKIQPWLLRANMTHLLQPVDLTFFCSLKRKLNELTHIWHGDPKNAGQVLSKYSVMDILYEATEQCLSNSSLIPNGFRRAGLLPWNPNAPDKTKLLPGTIYSGVTAATSPLVQVTVPPTPTLQQFSVPPLPTPQQLSVPPAPTLEQLSVSPLPTLEQVSVPPLPTLQQVSVPPLPTLHQVTAPPVCLVQQLNVPPISPVRQLTVPPTSQLQLMTVTPTSPVQQVALTPASPLQLVAVPSTSPLQQVTPTSPLQLETVPSTCTVQQLTVTPTSSVQQVTSHSLDITENIVETDHSLDEAFEPPFPSTFKEVTDGSDKPFWYGQTKLCSICNRRVMNSFFVSHSQRCSSRSETEKSTEVINDLAVKPSEVMDDESSTTEDIHIQLSTFPVFTLDDRKDHLEKFEVVLLKKNQVKEFEELFVQKKFTCVKDPLYRAWLNLKFAAAGTEVEAIDRILASKIAKNVAKRKNKRNDSQPNGPARHDPSSAEWVSILNDQKDKKTKSAPKRKLQTETGLAEQQTKKKKKAPEKQTPVSVQQVTVPPTFTLQQVTVPSTSTVQKVTVPPNFPVQQVTVRPTFSQQQVAVPTTSTLQQVTVPPNFPQQHQQVTVRPTFPQQKVTVRPTFPQVVMRNRRKKVCDKENVNPFIS